MRRRPLRALARRPSTAFPPRSFAALAWSGLVAALLALLALSPALAEASAGPPGAVPFDLQLIPVRGAPRPATAWDRDGVLYLSVNEMGVLLDAVQSWRPELGRMALTVDRHELAVTDGSDIATVDGTQLVHLAGPAFLWGGVMMVPLELLVDADGRHQSWVGAPVQFSREDRRLSAAAHAGVVTEAGIEPVSAGWRLVLAADVPIRYDVIRSERASFVVHVDGIEYDPLLYPLPSEHDWFQGLRLRNLPDGLEVSFSPGAGAVGYRVDTPKPNRIEIFLGLDERDIREGDLRRFSSARDIVPTDLRTVVLDPGHGGDDGGARMNGADEAQLADRLCRLLAARLQDDLQVSVVFTHRPGENPGPADRAAAADAASGDVLLSVHFHDRPGGPAAFTAAIDRQGNPIPSDLATLGFRPFGGGQASYLVASRLLARNVVDAVSSGLGLTSQGVFPEDLPELEGATMPAMLLEFGRAPEGGKWGGDRLDEAAQGVVEGLRLYLLAGEGPR